MMKLRFDISVRNPWNGLSTGFGDPKSFSSTKNARPDSEHSFPKQLPVHVEKKRVLDHSPDISYQEVIFAIDCTNSGMMPDVVAICTIFDLFVPLSS